MHVFQVRVLVEYHQRAFPFQVSHHARHAVLRRYRDQHACVVGHQVTLDDLDPLVPAQLAEVLSDILSQLVVDGFAPILRREHDAVLAHPLRVGQAMRFLNHSRPHLSRSDS